MFRVLSLSLAMTTVLLTAAHAEPFLIRKDISLTYRKGDLSTEAGARMLLARITEAAREACGGSPMFYGTYSIAPELARKEFAVCQSNAVSKAVTTLNAPMLAKVYAYNEGAALRIAGR